MKPPDDQPETHGPDKDAAKAGYDHQYGLETRRNRSPLHTDQDPGRQNTRRHHCKKRQKEDGQQGRTQQHCSKRNSNKSNGKPQQERSKIIVLLRRGRPIRLRENAHAP